MRFGMDYGGTHLKAGLFNEDGSVLVFEERKLAAFTPRGDLLTNIIEFARKVIGNRTVKQGGLAIKGLVNQKTGVVEDDIGAGALLAGRNLSQEFAESLKIPFKIVNDARSYALGEWKFGAGQGSKAMVCLTLGTGLGCSLIVDGKPYYGAGPLGGLLGGHISIDRNGPDCPCGNRGCLELYCSATAFEKRVIDEHPELRDSANILPDFFKLIEHKDPGSKTTLRAFQEDLAIGIVNVIHAYGPDMVVLGGGVMNSAHLILPDLIDLVHQKAWTFPRRTIQIEAAKLGNKAAALGVAFL